MPFLNASPLLLEEPIRLASILEHSEAHRYTCLTKIVGTVGGNSRDPDLLAALLKAGMTAARFDFSHQDVAYHQETLGNLNEAMKKTGLMCAIICDTAGPEVTILNGGAEPVHVAEGSTVTFKSVPESNKGRVDATSDVMYLSVPGIAKAAKPGVEIFVGQYLFTGSETTSVWFEVTKVEGDDIICRARNSATLQGSFFTVHVAQLPIPLPTLSDADKHRLSQWAQHSSCDVLSLSFTRYPNDVRQARSFLSSLKGCSEAQIWAKIESLEGLKNFDAILEEADGIILGRGDLGIDVAPEKVFLFQKEAIQRCNMAGKPVVISRVVDTMTETPRPTRAEATDVANAVLDGVDAIMLGAETLRGLYPMESVKTVSLICGEAEKVFNQQYYFKWISQFVPDPMSELEALCSSAVSTAEDVHAACIIAFTSFGKTARFVAKYKPTMPVLVVVIPHLTSNQLAWTFSGEMQARQAQAVRGLFPILADSSPAASTSNDTMLKRAVQRGKERGLIRARERIVVVQKLKDSWVVRVVDA